MIQNGNNDPARYSFNKYNMPLVEIKDFNVLSDSKSFFDQFVKDKQETYEKLIEMSRNDDYRLYIRKFIRLFVSSTIL